ncbi:TetR/AcrR family transcriptional regulator [Kibdelosporangium persicum]|uniref:TetR/AcrR family transcriptional regulator n=1 Tax=Kibdelosporangium persicum TaxID=2698649 RepID=UPI001563B483|nr:TetR/AcrR family transcriptional regulator [Kibdelosporangium persicum]
MASGTGDPRDRLVRLAVEMADAAGLDAVSMRTLAERAGIPAHALYRCVRNRADLLAGMAENVINGRMPHRKAPADPRARLERLARDEWTMYRHHPWLLAILATGQPPTGPAVLSMVDRTVEALTHAGYDPSDAFAAYLALGGYIQGMALLIERETADTTYRAWWSTTLNRLENTGRTQHRPWLAAARRIDPAHTDANLDTWFDFGLQRLLDGLLNPQRGPFPVPQTTKTVPAP